MRIVHIITRLILGGAQENTLLTVDGLHHEHGDDVTLITGPAEGPEGDLFARAGARGLKVEVMPELVRAIRPGTDWGRAASLRRRGCGRSQDPPRVISTGPQLPTQCHFVGTSADAGCPQDPQK